MRFLTTYKIITLLGNHGVHYCLSSVEGYTSISVREPLANIIAQTKGAQLQRQGIRVPTDPHYATVSDDSGNLLYSNSHFYIHRFERVLNISRHFSDEMYAAIDEQDKVYTSESETYAQIQPMVSEVNRPAQPEQSGVGQVPRAEDHVPAPQPPSVDSLRHVAHAHSRQGIDPRFEKSDSLPRVIKWETFSFDSFIVECHKFYSEPQLSETRKASSEFAFASSTRRLIRHVFFHRQTQQNRGTLEVQHCFRHILGRHVREGHEEEEGKRRFARAIVQHQHLQFRSAAAEKKTEFSRAQSSVLVESRIGASET